MNSEYIVILLFFFFKQKTAYEMRISDWSSDVCSSDLRRARQATESASNSMTTSSATASAPMMRLPANGGRFARVTSWCRQTTALSCSIDRKSVVEGKSVSVRVDLGGRRIMNKKKVVYSDIFRYCILLLYSLIYF